MKRRQFLLLSLVLLAGCGGLKVSHDYDTGYDFGLVSRYAWAEPPVTKAGPHTNPLNDRRIREAIDTVLPERGLRRDDRSPDLLVRYRFRVEQKERTSTVSVFGSVGNWGRHGGVSIGMGAPVTSVSTPYQVGELTIDLLDAGDRRLVWRGTGRAELGGDADPAQRSQALREAIRAILAAYPPKPGASARQEVTP